MLGELAERGARGELGDATILVAAAAANVPASGRANGDPLLRGVDPATQRASTTPRPTAPAPGFKTSAKTSALLLDQARESVFKQILLKLTGDGGEMRMRLDPPEFGEIDLKMVVEHGNRLQLSITAERPELTDMLQRHVDELARTLASAGLELTHADVQTRDAGGRTDLADDGSFGEPDQSTNESDNDNDIRGPKSGGYIRADGLDFWV